MNGYTNTRYKGKYIKPTVKTSEGEVLYKQLLSIGVNLEESKTVQTLLNLIAPVELAKNDRIETLTYMRVKQRKQLHDFKNLSFHHIAVCHSIGLIDKKTFKAVAQLPASPLRGLLGYQVSGLIGAWIHSNLKQRVFTSSNLANWVDSNQRVKTLEVLRNLGFVHLCTYNEVFKFSKKLARPNIKYYIITKEGEKALKGYFDLFKKRFERLLNENYTTDLLEMLKNTDF
jgi:hypothetical protein